MKKILLIILCIGFAMSQYYGGVYNYTLEKYTNLKQEKIDYFLSWKRGDNLGKLQKNIFAWHERELKLITELEEMYEPNSEERWALRKQYRDRMLYGEADSKMAINFMASKFTKEQNEILDRWYEDNMLKFEKYEIIMDEIRKMTHNVGSDAKTEDECWNLYHGLWDNGKCDNGISAENRPWWIEDFFIADKEY